MASRSLFDRDAGVLLHPTSLPGPYAIGDLGPTAHAWLRLLAGAGQTLWQVLPLNPVRREGSPYKSSSSPAINPLLISPDSLLEDGLLTRAETEAAAHSVAAHSAAAGRASFRLAREVKGRLIDAAMKRVFGSSGHGEVRASYAAFVERHRGWLDEYCGYVALQQRFGGAPWNEWPIEYRDRHPGAMRDVESADGPLRRAAFEQFLVERQWLALCRRAAELGVRVIGDLPIFVAPDSADVWAHRDLFQLDDAGRPTVVAGVPPDYFSATGQLWRNPLYDWDRHAADGFGWWRARVRRLLEQVDLARIDHFRGFAAYWEVPGDADTAVNGRWVRAPGRALFETFERALGRPLPFIAEDLGLITEDVIELRDEFGLPGIRVLQFGFGDDESAAGFRPEAYVPDCLACTGTHDNDTLIGWLDASARSADAATKRERERIVDYLGGEGDDMHWQLMRALYESDAGAVVVPVQDVLGLGSEARMNVPGRAEGNWRWRLTSLEPLGESLARLAEITRTSGRARGISR